MYSKRKRPLTTEIFFLDISYKAANLKFQIEEQLNNNKNISFEFAKNSQSIKECLCLSLGYANQDLPWNQLRALQFDLSKHFYNDEKRHTLACCDPVMMQVTHRGAYLWGQDELGFSYKEVIAIIARINEKLMGVSEHFYLLNNRQWLYVNEKEIELNQPSFEEEIGRDQFGFSYTGKDSKYWERLATEIQMLIKQMIDYEGLTGVPPESIVNVCFWGDSKQQLSKPIKFDGTVPLDSLDYKNLFTNSQLIKQFIEKSGKTAKPLIKIQNLIEDFGDENIIICLDEDDDYFSSELTKLTNLKWPKKIKSRMVELIFQDCRIILQPKRNFWQRLMND